MKTATISARIDDELKQNAEGIFRELGLTTSQAITLFYKQVSLNRGLPFPIQIPNTGTVEALHDAQTRTNLTQFNTPEDLFDDLGIA